MLRRSFYRSQSGQAIVIITFMTIVLFGAVGLALDGANGYYQNLQTERAAAAASLAGVIMEPGQPAQATSRAQAEAQRNGYVDGTNGATVTVVHGSSYGSPQEQKVTVCQQVQSFFMVIFGISNFNVCRTARAGYLSPITLGQPGNQMGSTVSQLGSGGNYYFMRTEGWGTDRQQGDGLTPNPCWEYGSAVTCPANPDIHQFNGQGGGENVFNGAPYNLPSRGGWNYLVSLPASGGSFWIYNAIYGPDWGNDIGSDRNRCDNMPTPRTCSSGNLNHYYHEEDGAGPVDPSIPGNSSANKNTYSAMSYTIFAVQNIFFRDQDVPLAKLTVKPVDASHWNDGTPHYWNLNTDSAITQDYVCDPTCRPNNMLTYHAWANIAHYTQGSTTSHPNDDGTATLQTFAAFSTYAQGSWDFKPGQYRVRVDAYNYDGTAFNYAGDGHSPQQSDAHKGYSVAVSGPGQGNGPGFQNAPAACPGCSLGAWNDISWYTPISLSLAGYYDIPIMSLSQQYAGQTVVLDLYDPGDVGGAGTVTLQLINPDTLSVLTEPPATPIVLYDSGRARIPPTSPPYPDCTSGSIGADGNEHITNPPCNYTVGFTNTTAEWISYDGTNYNNGHWIHMEAKIPNNYTGTVNGTYWRLRYSISAGITATDTLTFKAGLKGSPAHLFDS